jgi:hypothetical protein
VILRAMLLHYIFLSSYLFLLLLCSFWDSSHPTTLHPIHQQLSSFTSLLAVCKPWS